MFSGGKTLDGGTVGASAGTLASSTKSSKAAGREDPDHVGAVGADGEPVRDLARAERVLAGAELDGLFAVLDRHGPVEDVEALVFAVVHVQRGLQARRRGDLDEGVPAAGVGGGRLHLGEHAEEPALLATGGGGLGGDRRLACHRCLLAGRLGGVGEDDVGDYT
jgi:hypothetical protein